MNLQLSKQYPFNFVVMAFKIAERKIDERALAKFDAYEVDAFLQERSASEREAVEWALRDDDGATPPDAKYLPTLAQVAFRFEHEYLNGRFGLVSLADYNGLAISWPAVAALVDRIDLFKDGDAKGCQHCLLDVREKLALFALNARSYSKQHLALDSKIAEKFPVLSLPLDAQARELLTNYGIETVGDLTRVTADFLLNIKGFGDRRLERVRDCLAKYNAHLLGE